MDGALWVVRFFLFFPFSNSGGGVLQNLMLEGGPEAPFTSPISYLRQSHGTEPSTEHRGRPVGGNQVLATFAHQATPTFNLTCLESRRVESLLACLLARSQWPRLPGTMWSQARTLPNQWACSGWRVCGICRAQTMHMHDRMEGEEAGETSTASIQRLQPERGKESSSEAALYGGEDAQREEWNSRYALFLNNRKLCSDFL